MRVIAENVAIRQRGEQWIAAIYCNRRRCHSEIQYPLAAQTKDEALSSESWAEAASHTLPDGWVQLRMGGDNRIDNARNFCSAHCAALWLNAYNRGD